MTFVENELVFYVCKAHGIEWTIPAMIIKATEPKCVIQIQKANGELQTLRVAPSRLRKLPKNDSLPKR
jgi:hypothetical protein